MPSLDAVLLPRVFPSELLSWGNSCGTLNPNADTYTKVCTLVTDDDKAKVEAEEPYSTIVSLDHRGRFDIGLTKYLGSRFNARSTTLLSIEAEKLEYRALKNATEVFRRVTADDDARKWIKDMVLNKAPCYFVIGLQVLCSADFKRAVLKDGGAGAYLTVPLEATAQIPLHLKGELSADRFAKSTGKVNGIFGIQVQRLHSKIDSAGNPTLKGDIHLQGLHRAVL